MKTFRKMIFWCHLAVGVLGGLVIFLMSVTGVLLTYEKQLVWLADTRGYHAAPSVAGAERLPIETLLTQARTTQPNAVVSGVTMRADAHAPAAISLIGGRTLYVNTYTGEALGEGSPRTRNFFHAVTDWHRWLGASGASRATGRAITGACNLGFLFIVLSGLYLWWPRQWTRQQLRNVTWFRRGLPGKARDFNWHNVIGFWSCLPLALVVLGGVVISYQWAGNLVYRVVGETPPRPAAPAAPPAQNAAPANTVAPLEGLNALWLRAEQQVGDWKSISLRLPNTAAAPVAFTLDAGTGGQPHKRATLTLDRQTGAVVRWEPFSTMTTGRKLRSFLRFAHTGEVGGLIGQTLAGLVSLGACFLVWTGLALSWRRLRAWWARRAVVVTQPPSVELENA